MSAPTESRIVDYGDGTIAAYYECPSTVQAMHPDGLCVTTLPPFQCDGNRPPMVACRCGKTHPVAPLSVSSYDTECACCHGVVPTSRHTGLCGSPYADL